VHSHLNVEIATLADGQSEAVLRLPVPRGAAVTNAVLWVNDKPMRGAFVERQRANDIYTSIVTRRRDPALITWDGPGWIAVSIFPLEKDRTRRLELDWIEPAAVADGRIQYRVPIVAEHDRLIGRASVKVNGKKVSTTTQELVAIAPADPRKVFARRVPGDPFQQMMVREPAADGPPHFVLIAETSAALGIVDRGRQRAALDVLLDGLPPDAKMTLLAADWDVTPLVEDAGSAAWPDALAKLDAIPSAGALHLERALHEAIERARKTNAPAILFVGVGGDGFNGDATAAPLAELRAAHLRLSALSVGGADVPQPLAKATADTGGEAIVLRSFEDVQPPLLDALRPRPSQPVLDARGDGEWHQLKTVTGGTVWIGHGLAAGIAADADTVRADAGSTLATDLASLWQRARLELLAAAHEQRGPAELIAGEERLHAKRVPGRGDLEREHGATSVVVRTVEDRVEPYAVHAMQAVEHRVDLRPLLVGHLTRRWVVGASNAHHLVERTDRIVVDRRSHTDVIVMRADCDVGVAQLRVAAADDPHDVVRRRFGGSINEASASTERQSRGPDRKLIERCGEHRARRCLRDRDDREWCDATRAGGIPIRLAPHAKRRGRAQVECGNHDRPGSGVAT